MKPNQDLEHLKLLSVFHYVLAGIMGLVACIPLIHLTVGILMLSGAFDDSNGGPPQVIGWLFISIPLCMIVGGWTLAICVALAGRRLARQTNYMFCLVVAAILCAFMPFGTILGVFTILVLVRPSVKQLFGVT